MKHEDFNHISNLAKGRRELRNFFKEKGVTGIDKNKERNTNPEQRKKRIIKEINKKIRDERNLAKKLVLKNLLNNYKKIEEEINRLEELEKLEKIETETKEKNSEVSKISKSEYFKVRQERKRFKIEELSQVFNNKEIFIDIYDLQHQIEQFQKEIDEISYQLQDTNLSEEMYNSLHKKLSSLQSKLNKFKKEKPTEYRGVELYNLHQDLKREGHIARVESTLKYIQEIKDALLSNQNIILSTHSGTGKTSLARFAVKMLTGYSPEFIDCNPQTREANVYAKDALKVKTINKESFSTTEISFQPLAKAMKEGKVCILDEFSSLDIGMMNIVKNKKVGDLVNIPGYSDPIKIKEGFLLIATMNPKSSKNSSKNIVPPEIEREFGKKIKISYHSPEEGYDIFLARILNEKGNTPFSFNDLGKDGCVVKLLKAMEIIQQSYQGILSTDTATQMQIKDSGSTKSPQLKKFLLTHSFIENLIKEYQYKKDEISFLELIDIKLKEELEHISTDYQEDALLAAKILISKGLLSTIDNEELKKSLQCEDKDLFVGSRSTLTVKNIQEEITKSKKIQSLTLKDLAELDPFERGKRVVKKAYKGLLDRVVIPTSITQTSKQETKELNQDELTKNINKVLTKLKLDKKATFSIGDKNEVRFEGATRNNIISIIKDPNCKLTSLDLRGDNIGPDGANAIAAIAEALKDPECKLTSLNLGENYIGDTGAKAIAAALKDPNCKLTSLNFGFNNIGDTGANAIAAALTNPNCKLTSLDLQSNNIGPDGAKAIAEALKDANCKLTSLNLGANNIGSAAAMAIAQALKDPNCISRGLKITT